jgi:outer membrane receptor protein involved in Fe transport
VINRGSTDSVAGGALVQLIDTRPLLGGTNRLVTGFSHDRSRTRFAASSELGALTDSRGIDGLGSIIDQADGAITPVAVVARTRNTALFVADTLPLGSRLSARLGLRWNEASVALDDQLGTAIEGQHHFRRLNPGVEVDYRLNSALSLRAGWSQANRAPTPAELACADPQAPCSLTNFFVGDPPLKQVVATSWQVGASGRLEARGRSSGGRQHGEPPPMTTFSS